MSSRQERKEGIFSITSAGLEGKQSVRATFRLPENIIRLLGLVASQLGLKQKSLFDLLIEDKDILKKLARQGRSTVHKRERRQKTYVLSRRSLATLEEVARHQEIGRDVLVELSIARLLPVLNDEQEKLRKRQQIHRRMQSFLRTGEKIQAEVRQELGDEDRCTEKIRKIVDLCRANIHELELDIARGQNMAEYDLNTP